MKQSNMKIHLSKCYSGQSKDRIIEIVNELMGSEESIPFKHFTMKVKECTSYIPNTSKKEKKLRETFKAYINRNNGMDTKKDKEFINAILGLEDNKNDEYEKFDLILAFYENDKELKDFAASLPIVKDPNAPEKGVKGVVVAKGEDGEGDEEAPDEEEEPPKPQKEKDKPKGGIAILNKEESKGGLPKFEAMSKEAQSIFGKLKDEVEDFSALRAKLLNNDAKKGMTKEELAEENKQFNRLISSFVKNYNEIATEGNIKSNVEKVRTFFSKNNGSADLRDAKNEFSFDSVDVLDFWKKVETWSQKTNFKGDDPEKYIFVFLKLDTEDFMVNLKQLERFYEKISDKNRPTKERQIKDILKSVYDHLTKIIGVKDLDKSFDIQREVIVKDGLKINKGSTEELIHNLLEFTKDEKNKNKLLDSFKAHMDAQKEVSEKDFKIVLDNVGIPNTAKQRQQLFKLIDKNNDVMMEYSELEDFLNTYDSGRELSSNILSKGLKNQPVMKMLKEACNLQTGIAEDEYFMRETFTTILNSDTAALKKVEEIIDQMNKNRQKIYFDTEFGPKDKNDFEGSKMSLYANGEAPPGYIKPEQIDWLYPKDYADGE